jgi:hypothetical protein
MRQLLLILILAAVPRPAWAWGSLAHRLIARMAEDRLSGDARRAIHRLLGGESLAESSSWADRIKSKRRETAPWHFINVPIDASMLGWARYCPRNGCLLSAIDRFSGVLADRSRPDAERAEALLFLVHFLGDLHNPLHVVDRDDRGGNNVVVTWHGRTTNLHAVWDASLLSAAGLDEDRWLGRLRKVGKRLDRKEVERGGIPEWAAESQALARQFVYALPAPPELAEGYGVENLPRAEDRLARAGIRLAALLNRILSN